MIRLDPLIQGLGTKWTSPRRRDWSLYAVPFFLILLIVAVYPRQITASWAVFLTIIQYQQTRHLLKAQLQALEYKEKLQLMCQVMTCMATDESLHCPGLALTQV